MHASPASLVERPIAPVHAAHVGTQAGRCNLSQLSAHLQHMPFIDKWQKVIAGYCVLQEKGFSSHNSYSLSKLASMMFTFELAELLKPRGVAVNCLDPGTVNTKMLLAGQALKPCS